MDTRPARSACTAVRDLIILIATCLKGSVGNMKAIVFGNRLRMAALLGLCGILAAPAVPAMKSMAVIVAAGSKLTDVSVADLAKLCKGAQKTWPDGKSFMLVLKDPESPELRVAVQKLFGAGPSDAKVAIGKLNESRQVIKIVESDEDLLHTVEATPGAIGLLDVYAINSSVKVLRVDGKLPFDVGYAFKGN